MAETLIISLSICFVLTAIALALSAVSKRKRSLNYRKQAAKISRQTIATNHPMHRELVRRLGGDQATAQRLIKAAKLKYPGHKDTWYWEKVLHDLGRDRRSL